MAGGDRPVWGAAAHSAALINFRINISIMKLMPILKFCKNFFNFFNFRGVVGSGMFVFSKSRLF